MPNFEIWRDLARRIRDEHDLEEMLRLAEELIAKYDEEQLRLVPLNKQPPASPPAHPKTKP
jgi:hypothetical protein